MKKMYRGFLKIKRKIDLFFLKKKTSIAEWVSIFKKRKLYKDIKFSKEESTDIKKFWQNNYGKKVSKRWHKLYQSINGTFKKDYIPDYIFSTIIEPALNPVEISRFYSDKGITELLYQSIEGINFPKTLILNSSGFYYNEKRNLISKETALEVLSEYENFVIKPTIGGSSGFGVKVIDLNETVRKEKINKIFNEYKENFIIQEKIIAHDSLKKLYSDSINTIRLITYVVESEIHHAPISLRMGTGTSKVDNIHSGGIVIGVLDDGRLKKYAYKLGYCDSKIKFDTHPTTNIVFENYQIPHIKEMINLAKKLHTHTPHLGIISWDLTIDEKGHVILIEGNYFGQSVWFPQIVNEEPIFRENTAILLKEFKKRN